MAEVLNPSVLAVNTSNAKRVQRAGRVVCCDAGFRV